MLHKYRQAGTQALPTLAAEVFGIHNTEQHFGRKFKRPVKLPFQQNWSIKQCKS